MNNEELNKKVKSAFENIAPDNFQSILSDCKNQKGSVVNMTTNKKFNFKKFAAVAAAFVVLFAGFAAVAVNKQASSVVSTVSIDVNPSIDIRLNQSEKVVEVVPLNNDAEKIIGTMDFKGADLTVTVNALIGSMLRNGYLSDIANSLLVTVEGNDHAKNEEVRKKVEGEIAQALKGVDFEAAIVKQEIDEEDKLEEFAKKNNISEGKAKLVHEIAKELPHHTPEELAKLSINELNILAQSTEKVETAGEPSKKSYIGGEKALKIAYEKAGIVPEKAGITFESDDGVMVYEVEFVAEGMEYDFEINAITGEVINFEKDFDDDYKKPSANVKPETTKPETTKPVTDSAKYIGEAKAKEIALKKAGLSEGAIKGYRIEKDFDDGVAAYDIEFKSGDYEYSVEINAVTGAVTDFDKEYDDDYKKPAANAKPETTKPVADTSKYIGEAKAKEIVLKKAGLSEGAIKGYRIEKDFDDGVAAYDIEFKSGGYEYSVEINAVTGAVIDYDKGIDD